MPRTTLIALRGYRGKNIDIKHETPLSEVSYNLISAPMMEIGEDDVGLKMCVYNCLAMYYALPIASQCSQTLTETDS